MLRSLLQKTVGGRGTVQCPLPRKVNLWNIVLAVVLCLYDYGNIHSHSYCSLTVFQLMIQIEYRYPQYDGEAMIITDFFYEGMVLNTEQLGPINSLASCPLSVNVGVLSLYLSGCQQCNSSWDGPLSFIQYYQAKMLPTTHRGRKRSIILFYSINIFLQKSIPIIIVILSLKEHLQGYKKEVKVFVVWRLVQTF